MAKDDKVDVTFSQNEEGKWTFAQATEKVTPEVQAYLDEKADELAALDTMPPEIRPQTVPEHRIDMAKVAAKMMETDFFLDNHDLSPKSMEWMLGEILHADLYWVSPPMCELLQHAFPSLPPTTLTDDLMPSESGIVFFATPIVGKDARDSGHRVLVQAMLWGPCVFDIEEGTRTPSTIDTDIATFHFKGNGMSIAAWRKWGSWAPLGRTDWPMGLDTQSDFAPPAFTMTQLESIQEDRRILAAFALLSAQDKIATTTVVDPPNYVRKRLVRQRLAVPKVRLVDIHKSHKPSGQATGAKHIEWTHRWIVRGHWRQQPYGPKRQYRRPVYIASHIKGPNDLPLIEQDVVKVWR